LTCSKYTPRGKNRRNPQKTGCLNAKLHVTIGIAPKKEIFAQHKGLLGGSPDWKIRFSA
jgi:hypothetical protein